jgi:putative NADH-flavin reductase
MKISVVGATGRTGRQVVEQALARGHHVTALARRPDEIALRHARLSTVAADVSKLESLCDALTGSAAVISALGIGSSREPTAVYSEGVANVLRGMSAHQIDKLAVISAAPAGPRAEQPFLERRLAMPILDRIFGATYEDMRRMEATLSQSNVSWVSLRPPRLVDKKAKGRYRIDPVKPLRRARSLTYSDLATALLDSLHRPDLHRRAVYVAN